MVNKQALPPRGYTQATDCRRSTAHARKKIAMTAGERGDGHKRPTLGLRGCSIQPASPWGSVRA
jgi:hypothetical protein